MYTRCKIRAFNFMDPPEWQRTSRTYSAHRKLKTEVQYRETGSSCWWNQCKKMENQVKQDVRTGKQEVGTRKQECDVGIKKNKKYHIKPLHKGRKVGVSVDQKEVTSKNTQQVSQPGLKSQKLILKNWRKKKLKYEKYSKKGSRKQKKGSKQSVYRKRKAVK